MIKFISMQQNTDDGDSLDSFMDNLEAISLDFALSGFKDEVNIPCPVHGNKDGLVGFIYVESKLTFSVLESCCPLHKKNIYETIEPKEDEKK